jgi:tRNA G18 (ribose-2'-O)-methylase SpoU
MLRIQEIRSLELPALQPYRTMRRHLDHQRQGIFVAEGEKVVRRLLQSDFTVVSVLLPAKWLKDLEPILQARPEEIEVYVAEKALLETLTGFSMYQGLLAVGKIPQPVTLESILKRSSKPYLLVAVDGITSAENLGGLVRNAAALGAHALLVGETSSSPFLRRAVRSSMGTIFKLPVVETTDLAACLRTLPQHGIRCVAAHPHAEGSTLSQAPLAEDCCLVFGSEGCGLSPNILAACPDKVAVPMQGGVDSLNVTCAAAVFLYETARQRGKA